MPGNAVVRYTIPMSDDSHTPGEDVSRTVAGITLLVIRAKKPETGMGHWLWYFFASAHGRAQLSNRMTVSATLKSLSANLREVVDSHVDLGDAPGRANPGDKMLTLVAPAGWGRLH